MWGHGEEPTPGSDRDPHGTGRRPRPPPSILRPPVASGSQSWPPKPDHFWPHQEAECQPAAVGPEPTPPTSADGGSSARLQQGQTPSGITKREGLRPHRGSGRSLGTVVAAPIPRPAKPGPVWLEAGPFSSQRLSAFGNMRPIAGRQHTQKTQRPDEHSRGVSFRTAIFPRDIFLVSKNRSGCGNPRRAEHQSGKDRGQSCEDSCVLKRRVLREGKK